MQSVIAAIKAVRNRRAEMNVPPSRKASLHIVTENREAFGGSEAFFRKLASASDVTVCDGCDIEGAVCIVASDCKIYIPLAEMIDIAAEIARLQKEQANAEGEIKRLTGKLNNASFTSKAPAAVVEGERKKLAAWQEKLRGIIDEVNKLK